MPRSKFGTIYLLHFERSYQHARHYLGFTTNLQARLENHAKGTGARLLSVIKDAGISFSLCRTWTGTRRDERAKKNQKNGPRLCPICQQSNRGR